MIVEGKLMDGGYAVQFEFGRTPAAARFWSVPTVAGMLRNQAYIAVTYTERRSKRTGGQVAARWPALIDNPTWSSRACSVASTVAAGCNATPTRAAWRTTSAAAGP